MGGATMGPGTLYVCPGAVPLDPQVGGGPCLPPSRQPLPGSWVNDLVPFSQQAAGAGSAAWGNPET